MSQNGAEEQLIESRANNTPSPAEIRAARLAGMEAKTQQEFSNASTAHRMSEPFSPSAQDQLPFHRLIDSEIMPKLNKTQAVATLETLHTLLGNILNPPNESLIRKYRQIRLYNSKVKRDITEVNTKGPFDYLIKTGFRQTTIEFEPYLHFPPSPTPHVLHQLKVGHFVLNVHLIRAQEAKEREARMRESEKTAESMRVETALKAYQDDRLTKKERDARDQRIWAARQQEKEEKLASGVVHSNNASVPGGFSEQAIDRFDEDEEPGEEDDDEGEAEYPGTGQVLGGGSD